jgi:hypothetical protein
LVWIELSSTEQDPNCPLKSYTPKIPNTSIKRRTISVTLKSSGKDLNIEFTTIFKLSLERTNLKGLSALSDLKPFVNAFLDPKVDSKIQVKIENNTIEKSSTLKGSFR